MRQWTEEERRRQSELTKAQQPWKYSTGPKTAEGKAASSKNAHKHSLRSATSRSLMKALSDYRKVRRQLVARAMLKYDIQRQELKNFDEQTGKVSWLSSMAGETEIFSEAVVFPLNCR